MTLVGISVAKKPFFFCVVLFFYLVDYFIAN